PQQAVRRAARRSAQDRVVHRTGFPAELGARDDHAHVHRRDPPAGRHARDPDRRRAGRDAARGGRRSRAGAAEAPAPGPLQGRVRGGGRHAGRVGSRGAAPAPGRTPHHRSDRRPLSPAPRHRRAPGGQGARGAARGDAIGAGGAAGTVGRAAGERARTDRQPDGSQRRTPPEVSEVHSPMSTAKPGCPSDEIFTRLVEGLLPEDETRALEAHCDGCLTCARLLAELARAISPSGGAGGGGLLGDRYRLLEPLGAGGMGVVYAAFDTKLSRKVAVKRLRETGLGTPAEKRRGRFMREAQLLASLSHPNVLTVHDVGGADRELYVVMELVDGAPVSRWLSEARPDWRKIIDVFLQAGRGLVAAHQLGIVHRDIKPDNILVANNGRVLVGDFGLAGLAGNLTPVADPSPSPPSPGSLTQTGTVLGTPAYMSPEQHDGKPGDALSDQFSFAVSLYESLHGRRPFAGRSASEIAAATRSGQLAPGG